MSFRRTLPAIAGLALCVMSARIAGAQAMFVPNPEIRRAELAAYRAEMRKAAQKIIAQWKAAWERDDAAATAALYADNAFFAPPGGPPQETAKAVLEHLRATLPSASGLTIEMIDFEGAGDLSYATAKYSYIVTPPDAAAYMEQGMCVFVFTRDGRRLRIRSQVMTTDHGQP